MPSLARLAGVSLADAADALRAAELAGHLRDGRPTDEAAELVDALAPGLVAHVHAATALHLMQMGRERLDEALAHARLAATVDQSELAELVRRSGQLALDTSDYPTAVDLLGAALELGYFVDDAQHRRTLLLLARAHEGRGQVEAARELLAEVVRLADAAGDDDLLVEAAIRSAVPPDWRAGDRRTAAVLELAQQRHGSGPRSAALLAARGMVEMRIPASDDAVPQVAWVTRADVAQPMTELALALTDGRSDRDRLIATLGWRSTHRSPEHLPRRLPCSDEAVRLAQELSDPDRLVDAAVHQAVDGLECGDRAAYDRSRALIRWAADADRNPRLAWWSATTACGAALLDGDLDGAERHRLAAFEIGQEHEVPGWVAAEILLSAQLALHRADEAELRGYLVPSDTPILASPIARSCAAWMAALVGETDRAAKEARIALRAVDAESSVLLCGTLIARAAIDAGDDALAQTCGELLAPWHSHVAVDPSAWWCLGPVALTLAELHAHLGATDAARTALESADALIDDVGDVRSADRAARLRASLEPLGSARDDVPGSGAAAIALLTARERSVLALIARGGTNASIGAELAYSASTIRADTVSIYRKLGVGGRAEAAALAVAAGLAAPPSARRP